MIDLMLQAASAVAKARDADDCAMATDAGDDVPSTAAAYEHDAAEQFAALAVMAKGFERDYRLKELKHRQTPDRETAGAA